MVHNHGTYCPHGVDRGHAVATGKTQSMREEVKTVKLPHACEGAPLDWSDQDFSWNARTYEHRELEAAQGANRMKWIRQSLDEDSDVASSEGGARDEDAHRENQMVWAHHHLNEGMVRWPPYQIKKAGACGRFLY